MTSQLRDTGALSCYSARMTETYLFTNVGQITVPEPLASEINAIPRRKDGWWDQRYKLGKRAADWFDLVDYLAVEAWARGEQIRDMRLPGLKEAGA